MAHGDLNRCVVLAVGFQPATREGFGQSHRGPGWLTLTGAVFVSLLGRLGLGLPVGDPTGDVTGAIPHASLANADRWRLVWRAVPPPPVQGGYCDAHAAGGFVGVD
jgi:hypothetical protein